MREREREERERERKKENEREWAKWGYLLNNRKSKLILGFRCLLYGQRMRGCARMSEQERERQRERERERERRGPESRYPLNVSIMKQRLKQLKPDFFGRLR